MERTIDGGIAKFIPCVESRCSGTMGLDEETKCYNCNNCGVSLSLSDYQARLKEDNGKIDKRRKYEKGALCPQCPEGDKRPIKTSGLCTRCYAKKRYKKNHPNTEERGSSIKNHDCTQCIHYGICTIFEALDFNGIFKMLLIFRCKKFVKGKGVGYES